MTKYNINGIECIIYGNFPKELFPEATECNLLENKNLPIYNFDKLKRERRLEKEGIITFENLQAAYFLHKVKALAKSRTVRDYVFEKYTEILAESERTDYSAENKKESSEDSEHPSDLQD